MPRRTSPMQSEMLQATLDILILQTLVLGPAHGFAIAEAIERASDEVLQVEYQSDDLLKVETKATKGILRSDARTVPGLRLHASRRVNSIRLRVTSTWSNRNLKTEQS